MLVAAILFSWIFISSLYIGWKDGKTEPKGTIDFVTFTFWGLIGCFVAIFVYFILVVALSGVPQPIEVKDYEVYSVGNKVQYIDEDNNIIESSSHYHTQTKQNLDKQYFEIVKYDNNIIWHPDTEILYIPM